MRGYDRSLRLLAAGLSGVAGYVDAIGFMMAGGFFVSFMSGNTTRLGIGLASGSPEAALAAGLIGSFVAGVVAGSLAGRAAGARRRPVILTLVAALLALAAGLGAGTGGVYPVFLLAAAMGAENTVFVERGEVRIGLTYMTGTLVKLGKAITEALTGGERMGWAPYLLLWLGLLAGAVLGAMAFARLGPAALWGGAVAMAGAAVAAAWLDRRAGI